MVGRLNNLRYLGGFKQKSLLAIFDHQTFAIDVLINWLSCNLAYKA